MINLVVAMASEARPLIRAFDLHRAPGAVGFPIWEGAGFTLVVSGVGKTRAAAATTYLAGRSQSQAAQAWLNVGVAGHSSLACGRGLLAHKVVDGTSGRSFYPPQIVGATCRRSEVISVDEVESDYRQEAAYDMEAAAFWPTAVRFTTAELVQAFKVVSDNPHIGPETVDDLTIESLIESQVQAVAELATQLRDLAATLPRSLAPAVEPFVQRWRLSVTQQRQLSGLLSRLAALATPAQRESLVDDLVADLQADGGAVGGDEVVRRLEQRLARLPVTWRSPR